MTVIVYRDGIMAADSLLSDGSDRYRGSVRRIHRTKRRELVGLCGEHAIGMVFLAWLAGDRAEYPLLRDHGEVFGAILVDPNGDVSVFDEVGVPLTCTQHLSCAGRRLTSGWWRMHGPATRHDGA